MLYTLCACLRTPVPATYSDPSEAAAQLHDLWHRGGRDDLRYTLS